MKYQIMYSKEGGNTRLLADEVLKTIGKDSCISFNLSDINNILDSDILFVGFWTDKGSCDNLTKEVLEKLKNKKIFLFGSCGFGKDPSYFDVVLKRVKENIDSSNEVIGSFMCQGRMPITVRERYIKMKESNPNIPNIDMLIENFDEASSHPDDNDFKNLHESILKIIK